MIEGPLIKSIVVLIAALLVSGCALDKKNLPTLLPQGDLNSTSRSDASSDLVPAIDESPRTGIAVELPPTWTPGAPESEAASPSQAATSTVEPDADTKIYVVQPGDTLAEIAELFSVTLEQLARANDIVDLDHIETGQELIVPSP